MCEVAQALIKRGEVRGKAEGLSEGGNLMLYNLVQKGTLTVKEGATEQGVDIETFKNNMALCGFTPPEE